MAVLRRAAAAAVVALIAAVLQGQAPAAPHAHAHRTIATADPAAQAAFDRGLAMLYAFDIPAARDEFRAVERLDPASTIAYACEAMTDSFDINGPTTTAGELRGAEAVARGRAVAAHGAADERALFAAVAQRFDPRKKQPQRFATFAAALQAYADAHPQDGAGLTFAAYAGWNAADDILAKDGTLDAAGKTIARDLDAALALDPDDLGAHHLRIHFWESAFQPERALADADYLRSLTYDPGQSHLPHMAGHIYARLGDYAAMIDVNERAVANDAAYFKRGDGPGQAYMRGYHDHDVDFVLYGLSTLGRNADAQAVAQTEDARMRKRLAIRLHQNNAALAADGGVDAERVVAETRVGDFDAAARDLAAARKAGDAASGTDVAAAILAHARHDDGAAIAEYERARAALGRYPGDPKNLWPTPVGEGEGLVYLQSGRAAEAERVFRAELRAYPNDPRLAFGLAEALAAQHKDDTAARAIVTDRWRGDRPLTRDDLG